ncbi:hypothetical protein BDP27DRAFT_1414479 [Rhodocollybia butyracea]|uniref:Uncharacterized protein n=1 Tax=Rhodocollybia butyracea TaxID=206335 RepID=A0A9P5Q1Z5_9AGAR|nr:hypothetical protein BDP27DRAFT_1414479 [Rhodocollybia butyracea]
MLGLGDSNEDVIFLVLDTIRASTSKEQFLKDLRSLSLTSRYLRGLCIPLIFRIFRRTWDITVRKRNEILPSTLCQHVTVFELDVGSAADILVDEPTERLAAVFSQMSRLRTFRLINSLELGPWPALLKAVFTTPSLTSFEIWDSPWRRPEEKFTRDSLELPQEYSALHHFVYRVPFTDSFPRESESYGRRDRLQGLAEISNLLVLASLICNSVEILEIPAELALPLTDFAYPKLREFTVQGPEPLQTVEWTKIFLSAPQLRDVRFQTPVGSTEWSTPLDWMESSIPIIYPRDDFVTRGMANLESLIISNPSGKRQFFQLLPFGNLRTLSLKVFPLPDSTRWSGIHSQIPTSSEVLGILNAIQLFSLSTFELSYRVDDRDCDLLSRIHFSFPGLISLEIHRFRPLAKTNSDYDPLLWMPNALATIINLQYLKLNLDFPERPKCTDWRRDDLERYKSFRQFLKTNVAGTFMHTLPSLKMIGVLFHDAFSSYWDTWGVSEPRELVPQPLQPLPI